MRCPNCGKEFLNEIEFCTECGTKMPQNLPEDNLNTQQPITSGENNFTNPHPQQTAPKKKKTGLLISVVAVILVLVMGIGAFASPVVRNSAKKLVMSDEKYFKNVMSNSFDGFAGKTANSITLFKGLFAQDYSKSATASIKIGEGAKELINSNLGNEAKLITWIDEVSVNSNATVDSAQASGNSKLNINNTEILTLQAVADINNGVFYFTIPEINPTALKFDVSRTLNSSEFNEVFSKLKEIAGMIPDAEVSEEILIRYMDAVVNSVDEVNESKTKVTVGTITESYTRLDATISEETVKNATVAVLNELKNDEDIKKIIIDASNIFGEDGNVVYGEFLSEVNSALGEVSGYAATNVPVACFTAYVDNRGDIQGISVQIYQENVTLSYISASEKKSFCNTFSVNSPDLDFAIETNGTENDDTVTGITKVKANKIEIIDINFTNLDTKKASKGRFEGSISVKLASDASKTLSALPGNSNKELISVLANSEIVINGKSDSDDHQFTELNINNNGKLFIGITAESTATEATKLAPPSNAVDVTDQYALTNWGQNANLLGIVNKLEAAGMPTEYTSIMKMALMPVEEDMPTPDF